jgi:hypothetical protein
MSAVQNMATSAFVKINLNTLVFDTNSFWVPISNHFLIAETGYYRISARIRAFVNVVPSGSMELRLDVGSVGVTNLIIDSIKPPTTTHGSMLVGTTVIHLSLGATLELYFSADTGDFDLPGTAAPADSSWSEFSIEFLGV